MPVPPLPRDYSREPTLLTPQAVHALVRELLDYANAHQTWGVEVAEAFVDLIATRLSDTHAALDPLLAREVLGGIRAHWASAPLAYVDAVKNAARVTGPLILQHPLYGGIMGIMTSTGLADVFAKGFIQFANAHTLPFWNFIASLIISLFVPSAGGHWAVQGPFTVPAAVGLHASQAATAMGVAYGEQVADMIQPFWALPVVAVAGISIRRVMGFTVMSFLLGVALFGAALLVFV